MLPSPTRFEREDVVRSETDTQVVVFRIGRERYALPTTTAREVIAYEQPRRLPGAQSWVEGVLNLRGEIVPICDIMVTLGMDRVEVREQIVVCELATGTIGIVVEEVTTVIALRPDTLSRPATLQHPALAGLIKMDDELVVLLDLDAAIRGIGSLDLARIQEALAAGMEPEVADAAPVQSVDMEEAA